MNAKTESGQVGKWVRERPGKAPTYSLSHLLTCGFLLFSCAAGRAAPTLSTNLPPVTLALPDAGLSLVRVFGALAFVLALFLGGVWLFKNWQRLAIQRGRSTQLEILEMRALGNRHVLYVIGYQQQRLLLAASPSGVALVSHLPSGEEALAAAVEPAPAPAGVASPNFVRALQQAIQKKT
jgi:flagellar biogenesis protein FliO